MLRRLGFAEDWRQLPIAKVAIRGEGKGGQATCWHAERGAPGGWAAGGRTESGTMSGWGNREALVHRERRQGRGRRTAPGLHGAAELSSRSVMSQRSTSSAWETNVGSIGAPEPGEALPQGGGLSRAPYSNAKAWGRRWRPARGLACRVEGGKG